MKEKTKEQLISEVLERLAEGRYYASHDDLGETLVIQTYGPNLQEVADFFEGELAELWLIKMANDEARLKGSQVRLDEAGEQPTREELLARIADLEAAIKPLSEVWSDYWTEAFLKQIFGESLAPEFYGRLRGLPYEEVISRVYSLMHDGVRKALTAATFEREKLTAEQAKSLASLLPAPSSPENLQVLVDVYARQLGGQFPRMIRRAEKLESLFVSRAVPEQVQDYLAEASKCYIAGRFIGSVLVCRSAIEFAVNNLLVSAGKQKEIEQLEHQGRRTLGNLILLAQETLPWTHKATLEEADSVRKRVNIAVHFDRLEDDECRDLYFRTRGILRDLYS